MKNYKTFVSTPYELNTNPPPHCTGAAVDVVLLDNENNKIKFDADTDDFSNESSTRFYEQKLEAGTLIEEEKIYLANRRLLYNIMTSVGFINYEYEFWHYGYGDTLSSNIIGTDAIYGYIELKN